MIIDEGPHGPRALLLAEPTPAELAELRERAVAEIVMNNGRGWRGPRVDFLTELPWLRALTLLAKIEDDSAVFRLNDLVDLNLSTYSKAKASFASMTQLRHLTFIWRRGTTGIGSLVRLHSLALIGYGVHTLNELAAMQRLATLQVLGGSLRDLRGVGALAGLRTLRLGNLRSLSSLDGIEHAQGLESLTVDTCKRVTSVEPLAACENLRELRLDNLGPIEGLRPLRALKRLERVQFVESTNVQDGEIAFFRSMGLRRVWFANRKHYDVTREALAASPT